MSPTGVRSPGTNTNHYGDSAWYILPDGYYNYYYIFTGTSYG